MSRWRLPGVKEEFYKSLGYLGSWILAALISALLGVLAVSLFSSALVAVKSNLRISGPWIIAVAGIGAGIAALISRVDPDSRGEGIPSYIRGVKIEGGYLPLKASIVKFFSSFATLATWGNGGLIGPLGRVVSGLSSSLVGLISPGRDNHSLRRTAAICGLSSVVAAITGAPIGSGIFAVEIIQKRNMRYSDLFPSVLSGTIAVFFSRRFSYPRLFDLDIPAASMELSLLPALLVTSLLAAAGGRAFEMFYGSVSTLSRRDTQRAVELRFIAAAVLTVGISWAANPLMLGTGADFLRTLLIDPGVVAGRLGTGIPLAIAALLMIIIRAFSVGVTVGSGQSAGFFGPLAQIGVLLGTLTAFIFGRSGTSADLHILQAAGMAGLIASSLNVPLSAAIIVSEVFGAHLGFPAAIAAILGFQLNRHHTVYDVGSAEVNSADSKAAERL